MSEQDIGGQAFPHTAEYEWCSPDQIEGMSLLDYFAGQALNGILGFNESKEAIDEISLKHGKSATVTASEIAYQIADAMVAEKRRREQ